MFPWGYDGGFGIVAIVGIVLMVAFWALIIVGLVLAVRWLIRADRTAGSVALAAAGVVQVDGLTSRWRSSGSATPGGRSTTRSTSAASGR